MSDRPDRDDPTEPTLAVATARVADRMWMLCTAVLLALIWLSVLVISVFAPDLVSGSQQDHLPLAAFTTWIWGSVATAAVLFTMAKLRGDPDNRPIWLGYGVAAAVIWVVATVLALALPDLETGTDPTRLPLGALLAPLGAAVLSGLAGAVAVIFARPPPGLQRT